MPTTKSVTRDQSKFESTLGALVAHPTRVKAYVILVERVASPQEIAHELGLNLSHVGYHVRRLEALGVADLVDEKPVRGAVEHFYRATSRPFATEEDLREMTPERRESLTRYILQLILTDAARAVDAETFDKRLNRWLVRVPIRLDDKGFDEMAELHANLYDLTLKVEGNVANRVAQDPTIETVPAQSAALFHELPGRDSRPQ